MATPTYDLLDSVTLSSSASSVTFSSIDQSYRDLVLVADILSTGSSQNVNFRFTTGVDSLHNSVYMRGDGVSAESGTSSNSYQIFVPTSADSASRLSLALQFLDYTATDKHKVVLGRAGRADKSTSAFAGRWANTSAMDTLYLTNNQFAAGSTFHLYGVAS